MSIFKKNLVMLQVFVVSVIKKIVQNLLFYLNLFFQASKKTEGYLNISGTRNEFFTNLTFNETNQKSNTMAQNE